MGKVPESSKRNKWIMSQIICFYFKNYIELELTMSAKFLRLILMVKDIY